MSWTEEQISTYQIHNKQMLAEVNATLRPDENLSGKCGVFVQGQAGDLMTAMSVLKYRDQVFGKRKIIWFANQPNADCLRYSPISEVRPWPWPGNGLPVDSPGDFYPILCDNDNGLNLELAKNYELTADLDDGYFPAPWQLPPQKRHGWDYPNCSRHVFGVQDDYEWHPLLSFSDAEKEAARMFMDYTGTGKNVMIESFAGSDQSKITHEMIMDAMFTCREYWPNCNFIFASHKYLRNQEKFPEDFFKQENIFSAADFTVRQCALLGSYMDLIISVSSGITVACSCWDAKPVQIIQCCGSRVCSTQSLAKGRPFELVTMDNKTYDQSRYEFRTTLEKILNQYK